jgi:hypothetical protein
MKLRLRVLSFAWTLVAAIAMAQPPGLPLSVAEQSLLASANNDRIANGLRPVQVDAQLTRAAVVHARQMAAHRSISHQFPGEAELADRVAATGSRFSLVTENVAESGNAGRIHDLWMHSSGHRANILDPQVDSIGIAVIYREGQFYAVEDFSHAIQDLSLDQQEAAIVHLVEAAGVSAVAAEPAVRATCSMDTGFSGERAPAFVMRFSGADLTKLPDQLVTRIRSGRYHEAAVVACPGRKTTPFAGYTVAVLLYP